MLANDHWHPEGRDDLVIKKSGDAWLLYDPTSDSAHMLNKASALVWSLCTGEKGVEAIIAAALKACEGMEPPDDIQEILDGFQAAGLFVED